MLSLGVLVPAAASAASPPLVVGGMIVGLLLFGSFAYMLSKTFRNLSSHEPENRVAAAKADCEALEAEFEQYPEVATLHALVDGLRQAQSETEATLYSLALSRLTGRFFKHDLVAWDVWLNRECTTFVARTIARNQEISRPIALPLSS